MKTRTDKEIKVKANYSLRTFTIRTNGNKYRTSKQSKAEFQNMLFNTANDWQDFLHRSQDYYNVK